MNSPKVTSSPVFRNLRLKQKQSPVELKAQIRKNYKDKVRNCRDMLINRFRGSVEESDLRNTLTEIYKSISALDQTVDDEESGILEEIKNELVQEELEWWIQEYEKSQMENIDWSTIELEDNVICPVCQKSNFTLQNNILNCLNCSLYIKTHKSLQEIKKSILSSVDKHSSLCNGEIQFTVIPESNDTHIYIICQNCMEMQLVV